MLSQADLELLTLHVIDELPQKQIAVMLSCSQQNISKEFRKLKNFFKNGCKKSAFAAYHMRGFPLM